MGYGNDLGVLLCDIVDLRLPLTTNSFLTHFTFENFLNNMNLII